MLFINNTDHNIKERFGKTGKHSWKTIRPGDEVEISEIRGIKIGLTKVKNKQAN